ncbi:hypothetical protein [Fluoribacter gormanii]|uniref:Uncharacterized protein n=1 Tax=Fluoribacter gormanii TaxID=464 RepID=A0A377GI65_9GAMM|nr:hypothetical protein [Fluoribacter gormanii]KTD03469.1 hypothetical protein Lgor_1454 [Fluoribacter gormanii]SIQ47313.1 hypothetical protein SAMN05421777_101109 [Fluoribacter gormanii]STO24497.1 Uncharacterised protein [Fluoribacter gormanii]
MQQKIDVPTMKYGPDFNLFRAIQGKFYSILDDIKATADPGFIAYCLEECQKVLSMGSDITGMDAMPTSTFSGPGTYMAATPAIPASSQFIPTMPTSTFSGPGAYRVTTPVITPSNPIQPVMPTSAFSGPDPYKVTTSAIKPLIQIRPAMPTSGFSGPDPYRVTIPAITPLNQFQHSTTLAIKRKHPELIDLSTDVGNGKPIIQQPTIEEGAASPLTKRHKVAHPHLETADTREEKGKEKETIQALTTNTGMSKPGKIERKLVSPFLIEYIEQMAKGDLEEYQKVQREMIQKNERYNSLLSMRHISSIGQRSDLSKEIKPQFPDGLRNKFIYSHHISFPFTAKKSDHSLKRSARYQNELSRSEFISKEIIPHIKTAPSLAAQNLIYLYQHHLMYSIYLQRKSAEQLAEILIYHVNKWGVDLEKKELKILKSAINSSYPLIIRRKPFTNLIMQTPMRQIELPVERPKDRISDGAMIATIVLHDNPVKKIARNDTFDEPFPNSMKITQDTNFYDAKGKLIGVYRVGAIQPEMITDKLRKELSSVTPKQLSRMGAVSSEEKAKKRQNKEDFHISIRSAPFGVLGKKMGRIRPTQFSEEKFGIEVGLAPLFNTIEKIYAESAPVEYATRRRIMDYTSYFTIQGSSYLLAAEANYDKQTNAHIDSNKFPIHCLNPLFVIYPSKNGQQNDLQRTYEGAYTFFPGVRGVIPNDSQTYFEGLYFDLKEGDVLLWDFDRYFHCNTKLISSNGITDSSWHRISIVGFTKGEALHKIVEPLVLEDSDDEDSVLFSSEELTHAGQFSEETVFELPQSIQTKEQAASQDEHLETNVSSVAEDEPVDGLKLMSLASLLSSDNIIELEKLNDQVSEPMLDNFSQDVAVQKEESQSTEYYVKTNPLNLTFFGAEKPSQGKEVLQSTHVTPQFRQN